MNRTAKLLLVVALIALTMLLVTCKPMFFYLERIYKAYGNVTDASSGAPLGSVEVFISTYQYSELTNALGDYELELPEGTWKLEFIKDGYEILSKEVTVDETIPRVRVDAALIPIVPEPSPENGTITVRVTGADAHNGKNSYFVVGATGDDLSDPANWLGGHAGPMTITGGTAESIMLDYPAYTNPVVFTGGESYDVAGIIDVDGNNIPTSGDYSAFKTFVVDGNTIVELVYPTDFVIIP